jgi:hypothetical protein
MFKITDGDKQKPFYQSRPQKQSKIQFPTKTKYLFVCKPQ